MKSESEDMKWLNIITGFVIKIRIRSLAVPFLKANQIII